MEKGGALRGPALFSHSHGGAKWKKSLAYLSRSHGLPEKPW